MNGDNNYTPPNSKSNTNTDKNLAKNFNSDQNFQDQIMNISKALKSNPKFVCCPYCGIQGNTKIEQSCNGLTVFLSIIGCGVFWATAQCCRDKDINCRDADHYCVRCGNKLASYKST